MIENHKRFSMNNKKFAGKKIKTKETPKRILQTLTSKFEEQFSFSYQISLPKTGNQYFFSRIPNKSHRKQVICNEKIQLQRKREKFRAIREKKPIAKTNTRPRILRFLVKIQRLRKALPARDRKREEEKESLCNGNHREL